MRLDFREAAKRLMLVLLAAVAPATASAQTAALQPRFEAAATQGGPQALLATLDQTLADSPGLAADPDSAAALATAAAAAAGSLRGARSPVYRAIIIRIEAAAPAAARAQVGIAVARAVSMQVALAAPTPLPTQARDAPLALASAEGRLPESGVQPSPSSTDPGPQSLGIAMGSFVLYPDILLSQYWDDNIFATGTAREEDWVTVIAPSLAIRSRWDRHELKFKLDADLARYAENESENSNDYRAAAEGRYDLGEQTNAFAGVLYARDHEERSSPDDVAGFEPTRYTELRAYGGAAHDVGDLGLRAGATVKRLNFDDTASNLGLIDNDDRDRNEYTPGVRISYRLQPELVGYVKGVADLRHYDADLDAFGFDRDSKGYRVGVGLEYRLPGRFRADAFVGHMRQSYDDPQFDSPSAMAFSGSVSWNATTSTSVFGWVDRSIEETTLFASPAYRYTGAGVGVDHYLRGDLVLSGRASWANSDFYQSTRSDDEFDLGVSLKYFLTRQYYVAADYRFQHRDSTIPVVEYDRNQVFVRFGANF